MMPRPRQLYTMRSECPCACFRREHGRNKGEFNSLDRRLGLIVPTSLMPLGILARRILLRTPQWRPQGPAGLTQGPFEAPCDAPAGLVALPQGPDEADDGGKGGGA